MAGSIGQAFIEIVADASGFKKDVEKQASGAASNIADSMVGAGKKLTKTVTLPIVGAGIAILKMAGDFESSMKNVQAITGATGSDFTSLEDKAKELGKTTVFSASEAAEGMTFLGMAGFSTDQIIAAMDGTLALAAATQTDLGATADITSNILTGFGEEAGEAGRLADVLAYGAANSNTDLQQLGDAMKYVAPVASGLGMSMEETTAIIGKLSDAGIQGSMAGTTLRQALSKLANPTGAAAKALEGLGVEVQDSQGKMKPFPDIIDALGDAGAETSDLLEIFGDRAGPGMAALLSTGGDALREMTEELENSGGTAERMADTQLEGLNGQLQLLKSAAEGLAIAIADSGLLEWVTGIVEGFAGWVQSMADTNPKLLKILTGVLGVAAALGPLLILLGSALKSFIMMKAAMALLGTSFTGVIAATWAWTAALLANPITWIVIAIGALVAALVLFFTKTEAGQAIVTAVWGAIKTAIAFVVDWFTDVAVPAFIAAWDWIKDAAGAVAEWYEATLAPVFEAVGDAIVAVFEWLSETSAAVWEGIKEVASDVAAWFTENLAPVFEAFGELFGAIWERITEHVEVAGAIFGAVFELISIAATLLWEEGLQPIFEFIGEGFTLLGEMFTTVGAVISDAWAILWEGIQAVWEAVGPPLLAFISMAFENMKTVVMTVWNLLKTGIETVLGVIQGIISVITSAIKGDWKGVWEGIKKIAMTIWNGLKSSVSTIFNAIKTIITNVWNTIKSTTSRVWNSVKSAVMTPINAVKSGVSTAVNSVKSSVTTAWNKVKSTTKTAWNSMKTSVTTTISRVVSIVRGLPGKALSALGNIGSKLKGAGKKLITGFIDGIKGAIGGVKDSLSGLTDKLTSWKGPAERDKTLLKGAGQLIIGGFIDGLESQYDGVKSSLGGLTKDLSNTSMGSLNASIGVSGGRAGGRGGAINPPAGSLGGPAGASNASGTTYGGDTFHFAEGAFTLDVEDLDELKEIEDFVNMLQVKARKR